MYDQSCSLFIVSYSQGLADNTVVAKVNGEVWDLDRPFEKDSELKLLKFEDSEGTSAFNFIFLTKFVSPDLQMHTFLQLYYVHD